MSLIPPQLLAFLNIVMTVPLTFADRRDLQMRLEDPALPDEPMPIVAVVEKWLQTRPHLEQTYREGVEFYQMSSAAVAFAGPQLPYSVKKVLNAYLPSNPDPTLTASPPQEMNAASLAMKGATSFNPQPLLMAAEQIRFLIYESALDTAETIEEEWGVPVMCFIQADIDEQIPLNRVATVDVTLSPDQFNGSSTSTTQQAQVELNAQQTVVIQALAKLNCVMVGDDRVELTLGSLEDPCYLYFDVKATHLGPAELWIVVRQGQIPLSTLKLVPQVVKRASIRSYKTGEGTAVEPIISTDPPHQLSIIERRNGNQVTYQYELRSPSLGLLKICESPSITSDRYAYVESLYRDIETRWLANQADREAFAADLRAFGGELFDQLFPLELQWILWTHRHNLDSIMVLSSEPFIPWELVHLKSPEQGQLPPETLFLGQLGLVRWLYNAGWPPERILIRPERAYGIFPRYPGTLALPDTELEYHFLQQAFQILTVEPQPNPVRELISTPGNFDLLHFGGHGEADHQAMTQSKLLLEGQMQGGNYKRTFLSSTTIEQYGHFDDQNRPLVVINACQVGRTGYALTGISGFAQAFLGRGAGSFVGPLWSVGDRPARVFVETLYRELLAGTSLSRASTTARAQARHVGDSTWLAYTVYGHPSLRLEMAER